MKLLDMVIMCLRNLWRRKGRTLLTVIGVIIGSCAIIVMISLGQGMNAAMDNMLASFGDLNAITVYGNRYYGGGMIIDGDVDGGSNDKPKLDEDALEMMKGLDHVETVFPQMRVDGNYVTVTAGKNGRYRADWMNIYGVDFSALEKMGYIPEQGDYPTAEDTYHTIVFGNEAAYDFRDTKKRGQNSYTYKQMLPDGTWTEPFFDPMTESVLIYVNNTKKPNDDGTYPSGGRAYEFKMSTAAVLERDNNYDTVYSLLIDMNLARDIINSYNRLNSVKDAKEPEFSQVKLWVDDINNVDSVETILKDLGYDTSSMASQRKSMQGQLGMIQLILGCLAAISLLVAAIGITNTMIMSIYERTKEIGIMKVLGCVIGNIRLVFLMESGMIGLLGGAIGTIISFIISAVMNTLGSDVFSNMLGIYTDGSSPISIIPIWLVLLALGFSTVIGLISGFYPANRAVKISALEAIRNE